MSVERKIRIAVASEEPGGLDAVVSYTFGRAPVFTLVDVVDGEIKGASVHRNPHAGAPGGAGPAAAQFVANLGAQIAVAGGFGPYAIQALSAMGIEPVAGYAGARVREAIESIASRGAAGPPGGWGAPRWGPWGAPWTPLAIPPENEIEFLRQRKRWIEERLKEIEKRLSEL